MIKNMNKYRIFVVIAAFLTTFAASAETKLSTDKAKLSYGLGMKVAEHVLKQYGEVDYQILLEGIIAQRQGDKTLMTMEEASKALDASVLEMNQQKYVPIKEKGEAFLAAHAKLDGVTVTDSGLQYSVLTPADGLKPLATDSVTVHYLGSKIDGTEFDSSYSRGEPATFALNQVIPGWTEGVQLMSEGSKFKFVVPYLLGYGERGAGGTIGPFETLVFEVELIKINK